MISVKTTSKEYSIIFNINDLKEVIEISDSFIIITEKNIPEHFLYNLKLKISEHHKSFYAINLEKSGEENKTIENVGNICTDILENLKITRKTCLVAIGGGTIGDLGGFIASILMRGIKFIQVPTTLLAMVDSSVGGKNGVNLAGYKNMLGTFYQPDMVICNTSFLKTLNNNEYLSGYIELFKHAIISNYIDNFSSMLINGSDKIINKDEDFLCKIIQYSCQIKAHIVSLDELETKGIRNFLNFGHTMGHAIEKLPHLDGKIPHGIAVGIGMIYELRIAKYLNLIDHDIDKIIEMHFETLGIDTALVNASQYIDIMIDKMQLDKKNKSNLIALCIPEKIGHMKTFYIPLDDCMEALKSICCI